MQLPVAAEHKVMKTAWVISDKVMVGILIWARE
jgi:hypothetical protein